MLLQNVSIAPWIPLMTGWPHSTHTTAKDGETGVSSSVTLRLTLHLQSSFTGSLGFLKGTERKRNNPNNRTRTTIKTHTSILENQVAYIVYRKKYLQIVTLMKLNKFN